MIKAYDGNGGYNGSTYTPTVTSYTMTNGNTTAETVTNPLGQVVTTGLDPARSLPVQTTDVNGIVTNMHYDGLGRLIAVWENGRATSTAASLVYSYAVSNSVPSVVTTQRLNDSGNYLTSTALYDSQLRLRQTQVPTPQGGMLVTDDFYDSRGFEWKTNTNWWDQGANPGSTIVTVPDSQVPSQTFTQFDGLGRPVIVTSYDNSAVKSIAYSAYTGDKVTIVPPTGGTPTTVTTDAVGRQTELDSYTTAPTVTTGTNAGGFATVSLAGGASQATTYSYEARGWLSAIKDVSTGEQWTRTYNSLGQAITTTTPNAGTTTMSYDADGNLTSAADALGHAITYTYDPLSRRIGEYDGTSTSSPQIASWTYDNSNDAVPGLTNAVGQLTTETSTYNGNTYTFQQTGFNVFGESLGEKVTIPSAEGNLAGSYTLSHSYTATTGLPFRDTYPASPNGGALPAETVTHGYIASFDLPSTLSSGLATYTQPTIYTAFSQVAQEEIGSSTTNAYITNTYDPHTGMLTDSKVANTAITSTPYDDTSYAYDPSGNITSQQDVRNGSATELQCFGYDLLQRLTKAWTTDGTHPCTAGPSTGTGGTVSDGVTAGAYWTSWTYSPLGDQGTQTQHSVTGGTDTVATYAYNGNGKSQPDTLTSAVTTGPGAGTSTYSYDADGDTITRNLPSGNQTLAWYDDGKLKSDTTPAGITSYVYDAEGNLLLQKDPGQTTLFIFGEQLVLNTASGAVTGTRFLALPGGGTAVRTGAGNAYSFELTDTRGTSLLVLDNTCQNPAWREETPFGAPRGTATGAWPDTNGFLGKPTDTNTGLVIVGARNYDASLGRFISVDAIVETASPQQLNGYAYAGDNPVSQTDPSGLMPCIAEGPCGSFQFLEHWSSQQTHAAPAPICYYCYAPPIHSAPSLSLTIVVIQSMNIPQRRVWITSVLNYYGPAFQINSTFDRNISGVLAFFEDDNLGTNGSWSSWTDSTILNGIERGLAMARGSADSQGNPGAVKWAAFFQDTKREGLVFNDTQRKLWSHAEDTSTWYGMTNVGPAHGAYPTPQELSIGTGAQVYRWALRHQPGVDTVANDICGQICVRLANDATDPRYFDPTYDGAHILSGITQTGVGWFTGNYNEEASGALEAGRYAVKGVRDLVGWLTG